MVPIPTILYRTPGGKVKRPDPPWRSRDPIREIDPDVAESLRAARRIRGWTLKQASAQTGVSWRHICHLEFGDRAPSVAVAEILIDVYQLSGREADRLHSVARPHAGRSSPYLTGNPAPCNGHTHEETLSRLSPAGGTSDESTADAGNKPGNVRGQETWAATSSTADNPMGTSSTADNLMGQRPPPRIRRYLSGIDWTP